MAKRQVDSSLKNNSSIIVISSYKNTELYELDTLHAFPHLIPTIVLFGWYCVFHFIYFFVEV